MNRKRLWWVFPLVIAVSLLLMAQECEITISIDEFNTAPTGAVVNAKTGLGIDAATVSLTASGVTGSPFTTTTSSTGSFSFPTETETPIPPGNYTLTAEKAGVVFAPRTVSINGKSQDLGEVIGFKFTEQQASDLVFALVWDDDFDDVDAYLSYPWPVDGDTLDDTDVPDFTDPYVLPGAGDLGFAPTDADYQTLSTSGDILDGSTVIRQRVFWSNPSSATNSGKNDLGTPDYSYENGFAGPYDTYMVELDVDDTDGAGPETITVRVAPHFSDFGVGQGTWSTLGDGNTGLPTRDAPGYLWTGIMQYYAYAYNEGGDGADLLSTTDGQTAGATLYVFQGDTVLGVYDVPNYTDLKGASLVRINTFVITDGTEYFDYFQIVPDLRLMSDDDQIRGVADENGIITVRGAAR